MVIPGSSSHDSQNSESSSIFAVTPRTSQHVTQLSGATIRPSKGWRKLTETGMLAESVDVTFSSHWRQSAMREVNRGPVPYDKAPNLPGICSRLDRISHSRPRRGRYGALLWDVGRQHSLQQSDRKST